MFEEEYISENLHKFSLLDIILVEIVYFLVGVLIATNYYALMNMSWIFDIVIALIAMAPIIIHLFTIQGSLLDKIHHYVETNNPAYQTLLFFSMFFLGCTLANLLPVLSLVPWYGYIILMIVLSIKPMRSNLFW
ncbi:hypothetical protein [Francisella sp. 19X1-34]|uniref:hypothetical protein n=1 Tax=Francisella sp. 19X1-34 TaxID=3087177 RepID=UPI002E3222F0|nr:hypothetical protein [Francisella sp. 19X1-34]MED7789089.1 hypothetical protein [Francisella sp. 19X1-34]